MPERCLGLAAGDARSWTAGWCWLWPALPTTRALPRLPAASKRRMVAFAVEQQTALVEAGDKPTVTPPTLAVRRGSWGRQLGQAAGAWGSPGGAQREERKGLGAQRRSAPPAGEAADAT